MRQEFEPVEPLTRGDFDLEGRDPNTLVEMYRTMRKIREFELAAESLMEQGEFPGAVHLYLGQEAVATGVCLAVTDMFWRRAPIPSR